MRIYLVRHGDSDGAMDDNKRVLSQKGVQDIERLAKFIAPLELHVAEIYHSGKDRAAQTADMLSKVITCNKPANIRKELDPIAPVDIILDELNAENRDIMLVGHQPFMGSLASQMLFGRPHYDSVLVQTGTMMCLEKIADGQWAMAWMVHPELLS